MVDYASAQEIDKIDTVKTSIDSEIQNLSYMDEVIVTGVFDARTKMKSSVAITTIDEDQISKQAAVSYADMFKSIPGVFVNSSLGEIRNVVYSRGVSGSAASDAAEGTYYLSLQEDGLPVTMGSWQNYGPDYFLRPDITVKKIEAVRGGSAGITSANAPGGIFNYVSKTGGDKHKASISARYGLQSEKFHYAKTEFNVGGPLSKSTFYNLGGFYRYDQGNRYGGYPLNNGYQFKGNILQKFNGSTIMVYTKMLDDRNGWYEFLPAVNFDNPVLAPGVRSTDLYQLPNTIVEKIAFNSERNTFRYNPGDQIKNKDFALGVKYNSDLGNGWKIENNIKMSIKNRIWEGSGFSFAAGIDNESVTHLFTGTAENHGTLNFKDRATGEVLGSVLVNPDDKANPLTVKNGSGLPGQNILKNGVVTGLGLHYIHDISEVMNNIIINKKIESLKMSFTAGMFYSVLHMTGKEGFGAFGWTKLQSKPELLDVELIAIDGNVYKFTDPKSGLAYLGGSGWKTFETKMTDVAYFFGHNWDITNDLNIDWGVRYEEIRYQGTNFNNKAALYRGLKDGGLDGNVLTQYDNIGRSEGIDYFYDKKMPTLSYTAAISYKFSNQFATYIRFADGKKSPSLKPFLDNTFSPAGEKYEPVAQNIRQLEAGFKFKYNKFNAVLTPFYSRLSNFGTATIVADDNGAFYTPPPLNNSISTYGLELEAHGNSLLNMFNIDAAITLQKSIATKSKTWDVRTPARSDDTVVDGGSGNEAENTPRILFSITPAYYVNQFYTGLTVRYIGSRQANNFNVFKLPGFATVDFKLSYDLSKSVNVSYVCNNIFQSQGVMSWSAPSKGGQALDRAGFTKEKLEIAKKDGLPLSVLIVQPRSHFITITYNF